MITFSNDSVNNDHNDGWDDDDEGWMMDDVNIDGNHDVRDEMNDDDGCDDDE